jgi:hypothetical protein
MMDDRYATGALCGRIEGDRIRLSVQGSDWEISEIGDKIRHLTAAPKKTTDGSGEVSVPLTWAMVTQCARFMIEIGKKWSPSPELIEWVTDEFMRRHDEYSPDKGLRFDISQLGWTPMPHQIGGAYVGALNERFFFADDMRTGKTRTALLTLAEMEARGKDPWPAFVVAPASVVDPWMEELEAAFPGWPVAAYRGGKRRNLSTRYKVYVMSWNTFRDDMHVKQVAQCEQGTVTELTRAIEKAFSNHQMAPETYDAPLCPCCHREMTLVDTSRTKIPPLLEFLVPKTLVLDEAHALCLSHTSCITTSAGPKRISEVHEGDFVLGVDHSTGRDVWTRVKKVGRSPLRETVRLGGLELTPDHPVWVSDSGCIAYASSYAEEIHLRPLRYLIRAEALPESADAEILRQGVRMRGEIRGDESGPFSVGDSGSGGGGARERGQGALVAGYDGVPELGQEPVQGTAGRGDQEGVNGSEQEAWVSHADGRERGAYYPAGAVAEAARLGVHPRVRSEPWQEDAGLPNVLQGGHRASRLEARDRAGRELASFEVKAGARPEEGLEAGVAWLDGISDAERERPERYLWNIATDTGNYVAAGVLVHNCNVKTRQSVMARRCARVAKYAFLASGTPITKDVGGFWSALNVLDIRSFPDQERYQARYTDRYSREYGSPEIEGISTANKAEFFTLMQGSMRRISRSDVNKDLPPKTYQTRAVDVPAAHRKAYDEMRDDMIAHIPDTDEPLPVMTVLAQLQRLSQLASSACDVEIVYELDDKPGSETYGEMVPKYNVTMREPSWKIDALMELMDDNRGEPLICFSPHTQLVKLAGARAEKSGYKVGYIIGGQSQAQRTGIRKAFNAGKLDLLCANVTAGGVGLTLTGTDTIVFLERPWAYWQADQAQSRADDIRNAKQVHVIDIVAKNTVESRVREALKSKAGSLAELVRDPRIVEELLGGQSLRVLVRSS